MKRFDGDDDSHRNKNVRKSVDRSLSLVEVMNALTVVSESHIFSIYACILDSVFGAIHGCRFHGSYGSRRFGREGRGGAGKERA